MLSERSVTALRSSPTCTHPRCVFRATRTVDVFTAEGSTPADLCTAHARQLVSVLSRHVLTRRAAITRVRVLPLASAS
jgi:hypothetical protein